VVEAAVGGHDAVDRLRLVGLVVGLARHADRPVGAEAGDRLGQGAGVPAGEADPVAAVDERLRDGVPDAAAGAGDEGDLAVGAHGGLPSVLS
jgi:hypothetical protein